jgi:hypothetical protein
MIKLLCSPSLLAALVVIGSIIATPRPDTQDAEVRGVREGQCSQMHFFLATHGLKPLDEKITQEVYDKTCLGRD